MALAKLVCGACGAELRPGEERCPSCNAVIEYGTAASDRRCPICGTENRPGSDVCSACGAPLGNRKRVRERAPRRRSEDPRQPPRPAGSRQRDPWPIIAGIAVFGLIGYFVVTELTRDNPALRGAGTPPPAATSQPPVQRIDVAPLERAVMANPSDTQALLRLANALHDNGTWARAIETYKKYLAVHPDNPDARVDMGICYFEMAKTDTLHGSALLDTAVGEMQTAFTKNPKHQPAAFNLGVVFLTIGDIQESNRWFRRAVELDAASNLGRRAQAILEQHASIAE